VVSASFCGSPRVHPCKSYGRCPLPTVAFVRVLMHAVWYRETIRSELLSGTTCPASGSYGLYRAIRSSPTTSAVRSSSDTRETLIYLGARTSSTASASRRSPPAASVRRCIATRPPPWPRSGGPSC
jgi:hypothetical protein